MIPVQRSSAQWFDLPSGARDWLVRGELATYWMPPVRSDVDSESARGVLSQWDSVAGRLLRRSLFSEEDEPRELRQLAEAVAAVAQQLAEALQ